MSIIRYVASKGRMIWDLCFGKNLEGICHIFYGSATTPSWRGWI